VKVCFRRGLKKVQKGGGGGEIKNWVRLHDESGEKESAKDTSPSGRSFEEPFERAQKGGRRRKKRLTV